MVAHQGQMSFEALGSGGVGRFVQQAQTGDGGLTIDGADVLAFEPGLPWDIRRVQGAGTLSSGGLFNCVFSWAGRIAIMQGCASGALGRPSGAGGPVGRTLRRAPPRRPARVGHAAGPHHGEG
jgi:hypothetical protein